LAANYDAVLSKPDCILFKKQFQETHITKFSLTQTFTGNQNADSYCKRIFVRHNAETGS